MDFTNKCIIQYFRFVCDPKCRFPNDEISLLRGAVPKTLKRENERSYVEQFKMRNTGCGKRIIFIQ